VLARRDTVGGLDRPGGSTCSVLTARRTWLLTKRARPGGDTESFAQKGRDRASVSKAAGHSAKPKKSQSSAGWQRSANGMAVRR
jgi:hypothetical protein